MKPSYLPFPGRGGLTERDEQMSAQETKHSPLPWSIGVRQTNQTGFSDDINLAIGDMTDWVVARVADKQDAELIVRAVNNHESLIAALDKFGRHSTKCNFYVYEGGVVKTGADCDCGLTDALNKALGK
jgi:hypothetical protein